MNNALRTVWRYRQELLPLLVALAVTSLWRLQPLFVNGILGTDSSRETFLIFHTVTDVTAVLVIGAGLVLASRRGNDMHTALWAIVLVQPLYNLGWRAALAGGWTFEPSAAEQAYLWSLAMQMPIIAIVSAIAWRLGFLGRRHALLIAAAFAAWAWTFLDPWPWAYLSRSTGLEQTVAFLSVAFWAAAIGGIAFAFHHFPRWGKYNQRLAIACLALLPLAARVLWFLPLWYEDVQRRTLDIVTWPPPLTEYNILVLPLISGSLLLGLTWLLATRWPPRSHYNSSRNRQEGKAPRQA